MKPINFPALIFIMIMVLYVLVILVLLELFYFERTLVELVDAVNMLIEG